MLPADLFTAEAEALEALHQALASTSGGRWTVEFRFEGLRLLPLVLRLNQALAAAGLEPRLLFADMGATALARRDAGDAAANIASFGDQQRLQAEEARPWCVDWQGRCRTCSRQVKVNVDSVFP